jgi:YesN/AraC family two-component response regulator
MISGSSGKSPLPDRFLKQLKTDSGLFDYHLDGKDSTVTYTTSKQVGWYYIAVMPSDLYMQKVKQIERLAIWLFLLCIIAGIVAAYGVAYRNYFPIKRTVDAIANDMRQPRRPTFNELEFIMERLEFSWNEVRHVKDKLSQQMPLIRANYLQRLIQGYLELPDQMEQSLAFMDVRFPYRHFAVVLVQVECLSRFAPDQSEKQWALARFIISNLAEDLNDESHCIYTVELAKNRLALLINLNGDMPDQPTNGLTDIVNGLNRLLETRFKLYTIFAISGVHQGWQQIGEAYLEANAAIEYQLVKGQQSIFSFNDIRQESLQYHYPVETELQLINCIRSGEKEKAISLLHNLYEHNFRDDSITPELWRCLIISLAGTLLRILKSDTQIYRELVNGDIHPIRLLLSCKTTDEMFEKVKELYVMASESFHVERGDHSEQLLLRIESFIYDHFADSNMSLTLLSEHLQLTPQYISQFYKKASGRNLNDYLTQVRMERAKQILLDPQLTNAQIAKMIGYTNDTVFIRAFKKVEGVTPGKYRESVTR